MITHYIIIMMYYYLRKLHKDVMGLDIWTYLTVFNLGNILVNKDQMTSRRFAQHYISGREVPNHPDFSVILV